MYKHILHATDLSENHFRYCEKSLEISKTLNAKLYIMHVVESPNSLQIAQGLGFTEIYNPTEALKSAQQILSIIGESLKIADDQLIVEIGSIKESVLKKASELNCNLIIIGHKEKSSLPEFLQSSAHNIEPYAKCDVLSIY
jgi:nucleotide-binding universal stress UspA family protein